MCAITWFCYSFYKLGVGLNNFSGTEIIGATHHWQNFSCLVVVVLWSWFCFGACLDDSQVLPYQFFGVDCMRGRLFGSKPTFGSTPINWSPSSVFLPRRRLAGAAKTCAKKLARPSLAGLARGAIQTAPWSFAMCYQQCVVCTILWCKPYVCHANGSVRISSCRSLRPFASAIRIAM
jgi:hypothetical protein